jgi:TatD DNase family protein
MVDTHCHIFLEYYEDISKTIDEILKSGVNKIIVNGCDMKSNLEVLDLIKKYDCVYGAIGFHPTELSLVTEEDIIWLEKHLNDDKIVAIGEIGLDYHYDDTDKNKQQKWLKRQLELAEKYKKPIIVHSRDAIQDTFDILTKYNVRGSIHCYSGSVEMAREFVKKGYYIGVGGTITYSNSKRLAEVIKDIDLSYILLETDSPYLPPEGKRGEKNTPANIPLIAKKIAEIKEISVSEVEKITNRNASSLFDF